MSRSDRESAHAAAPWLLARATRMGFLPLISMLERLTPDAARVGDAGPYASEAIVFKHDPALTFSSGDVTHLDFQPLRDPESLDGEEGPLFAVTSSFLGLTGAATPLPHYLAEEIAQDQNERSPQRAFLDLFHHRLLSLLYRALSRMGVSAEASREGTDPWAKRLLALGGLDTFGETSPTSLPLDSLLRLLPLLALRSRSAASLELALGEVLGVELEGATVCVKQFVGEWVEIEERLRLGKSTNLLGRGAVLGERVFDRGGRITLCFRPLKNRVYRRLLPGGDLLPKVTEVVALFGWDPVAFDLDLGLAPGEAPELRLHPNGPAALGRDSWLGRVQDRELEVHTGAARA